MARFGWVGSRDFGTMIRDVRKESDRIIAEAEDALRESVIYGALMLQDLLEAAETETGRRRAKKGGSAGRHRSGNMIASVSHNGDRLVISGNTRTGSYGWFPNEFEPYFKLQDQGSTTPVEWPSRPGLFTTIPAAMALSDSQGYAIEEMRRRMQAIVRGR